ncbi:uncharacterized protein LOC130942004 [Arachis stenosperma]|uniref:uncharacterized protein LOC130942004 n=1 Tax=Arachis stenosperma TaxID=217475 RepID=UPI0025ACE9DB|nr:uncharacterized protein LOC130942004 [Arachis stenosperma]
MVPYITPLFCNVSPCPQQILIIFILIVFVQNISTTSYFPKMGGCASRPKTLEEELPVEVLTPKNIEAEVEAETEVKVETETEDTSLEKELPVDPPTPNIETQLEVEVEGASSEEKKEEGEAEGEKKEEATEEKKVEEVSSEPVDDAFVEVDKSFEKTTEEPPRVSGAWEFNFMGLALKI